MHNIWIAWGTRFPTDLWSLIRFSFFDVFIRYQEVATYNFVLWTMTVEFVGSFLVFGFLTLFGKVSYRWGFYLALLYTIRATQTPLYGFVFGMAFADVFRSRALITLQKSKSGLLISVAAIAAGICFSTFGRAFYSSGLAVSAAAFLLVFGCTHDRIRGAFENSLARFLGKISFPLYLLHMAVITSLASWIYLACQHQTPLVLTIAVALGTLIPSLLLATAFLPIERLAVWSARRFSDLLLSPASQSPGIGEIMDERLTA